MRVLFGRGLALVWFLAFASLWWQADGLYGPEGLQPLGPWLRAVSAQLSGDPLEIAWRAPTLAWFLPAAWAPGLLCLLGVVAAGVMASGRWVAPANLVAWVAYRSLTAVGGVFLAFQWDGLLLETGLVALAVLPWRRVPTRQASVIGWWGLRVLLFRVVFFSGVVKLTSGDAAWRSLSALSHHHETQPLPNVLGWMAHQLPWPIHTLSALGVFAIELPLAIAILGPRRLRVWGVGATALLMVLLALTGSYGFFQVLVLVLCLTGLDDDHLARLRLGWLRPDHAPAPPSKPGHAGAGVLVATMVGATLALGLPRYAQVPLPDALAPVPKLAGTVQLGNPYGLFAVMTTERPIPVLEARWGDGPWSEVRWAWQTSDPRLPPAQVAPHMPRLDWQLWFAGLGRCEGNAWVVTLMDRLLAGSEPVIDLVGDPRFLTRPPDALRLVRMTYRMTGFDGAPGQPEAWWTRQRGGAYCPGARTRDGWIPFSSGDDVTP